MADSTESDPASASSAPAPDPAATWNGPKLAQTGRLSRVQTIAALRLLARRRLPRPVFDYVDGGGENEITLGRNQSVFDRISFRPRTVADITGRNQSTSFFGRMSAAPFGIGAMGGLGLLWPEADLAMARVAAKANIPYVMATGASASMEQVAAAAPDGRRWFQLYAFSDDELNRRLLRRATAAGFEALIVTTDTQIGPKRLRDLGHGFGFPMQLRPRGMIDFAMKPDWLWRIGRHATTGRMGNMAVEIGGDPTAQQTFEFFKTGRCRSVGWEEIKRLREFWRGPMLLKGIVTAEETERAAALGIDGVVVSNHGGRNLDGTTATIEALPEVVAASAGRMTVLLDSGIRRGTDVAKALALGAQGVLLGRAAAFGVAAAGQAGVEHAVAMIHDEIDRALGFLGCQRPRELDPSFVRWNR